MFFVSNEHTNLHLFFDQVLSLCKVSDELLSLHLFQDPDLILVDDVCSLEGLLLVLKFLLLVSQLLSQQALLIVEV